MIAGRSDDKAGKLVGVISRPDILRAFVEPNFMTFA